MAKIDSITGRPYIIGESFTNPVIVKRVARVREPFFRMRWAAKGPSETKRELYQSGRLKRFPTVWRRAAKTQHIEKLGAVMNRRELPDFNELGAAPGPTDAKTTTSSTSRGVWGFLDNVITGAGAVIAQRQQLDIVKAQAQASQAQQFPTFLPTMYTPGGEGGLGILGWTAIIGLGGGAVYYFMNR